MEYHSVICYGRAIEEKKSEAVQVVRDHDDDDDDLIEEPPNNEAQVENVSEGPRVFVRAQHSISAEYARNKYVINSVLFKTQIQITDNESHRIHKHGKTIEEDEYTEHPR